MFPSSSFQHQLCIVLLGFTEPAIDRSTTFAVVIHFVSQNDLYCFKCFRVYGDDFEPEEVDSESANVESKEKTGSSPVKKAAAALRNSSVGEKDEIYDIPSDNLGC